MTTNEAVHVNVITFPRAAGWWLTPEGEAALDAADSASRAIADEARQLAIRRRSQQVSGDPPASL